MCYLHLGPCSSLGGTDKGLLEQPYHECMSLLISLRNAYTNKYIKINFKGRQKTLKMTPCHLSKNVYVLRMEKVFFHHLCTLVSGIFSECNLKRFFYFLLWWHRNSDMLNCLKNSASIQVLIIQKDGHSMFYWMPLLVYSSRALWFYSHLLLLILIIVILNSSFRERRRGRGILMSK